jgi:hypothetical protein
LSLDLYLSNFISLPFSVQVLGLLPRSTRRSLYLFFCSIFFISVLNQLIKKILLYKHFVDLTRFDSTLLGIQFSNSIQFNTFNLCSTILFCQLSRFDSTVGVPVEVLLVCFQPSTQLHLLTTSKLTDFVGFLPFLRTILRNIRIVNIVVPDSTTWSARHKCSSLFLGPSTIFLTSTSSRNLQFSMLPPHYLIQLSSVVLFITPTNLNARPPL